MKLSRAIAWSGCVILLGCTAACNRGNDKNQTSEPAPMRLAQPKARPVDRRIEIVQPAVDKGVAFLKKHILELDKLPAEFTSAKAEQYVAQVSGYSQARGTLRPGIAGLVGLALLEGGLAGDDPAILQIADMVRKEPSIGTYDMAASVFFLNRWHESEPLQESDRELARRLCLRIIAGQTPSGIWGYTGVLLQPDAEKNLMSSLKDGTYKPANANPVTTMSNTQFAMLAVWGCRKHGIAVREPLLALSAYFHGNQMPDGQWTYQAGRPVTEATSTCAGLIALAIERVLLEDEEFAAGRVMPVRPKKADLDKAFEFLGKTVGRKKGDPNPGSKTSPGFGGGLFDADAVGDLYFLWTLERVGVIYARDEMGGKDWYDWAYPVVMDAQQPDGSWDEKQPWGRFGQLVDTSFAILLLKRSNIAKDLTDKLQTLSFLVQPPPPFVHEPGRRPA